MTSYTNVEFEHFQVSRTSGIRTHHTGIIDDSHGSKRNIAECPNFQNQRSNEKSDVIDIG